MKDRRDFGRIGEAIAGLTDRITTNITRLRQAGTDVTSFEQWLNSIRTNAQQPFQARIDAGGMGILDDEEEPRVAQLFESYRSLAEHLETLPATA